MINHAGLHIQFNPQGCIYSVVDCEAREAFYHVEDSGRLPDYEVCTPLRMIFNWICTTLGLLFVHAAAIGNCGRGALIVGQSGAGKSTTALTCFTRGLEMVGDDYVALENGDEIVAHTIFGACKLTSHGLDRLPQLRPSQIETNRTGDKHVVIPSDDVGTFATSLRIIAIVRPTVVHAERSTFEKSSRISMLTEFAGSTILQMPGTGKAMLNSLSATCRRLPAYRLKLSDDADEIARSIGDFLATLEGAHG